MYGFRKEALTRTLKEEYGITNDEQLNEAIENMNKIDIAQFVSIPQKKNGDKKLCNTQNPQPTLYR